ncbi:Hypothetical protein CINCED_3A011775 [Cinara cedri]|uniref:Nuclear pore complex protein Nup98-Nup96 n=1 Tax=Cinara cedri TaxID=506608 RepID=A0A5E4MYX7_9HEMI|nr:Hypothetical protein CINCED_3A011775 [Cinara cedri]
MFGSGSGAFSGGAGNTSGFGQSAFGKPATPAVFGQSNTSLFNQTTQPNTGLFGANAAAPAFGQTPTAQPTFGGFNTGGTSLFGTPTATPGSSGGLFGQQNASMVGNTGGGLFGTSNPNTSFGQAKPVGSGFSFGAPAAQPTGNIFGTPQTSTANTGMFGASTAGTFGASSGFGATSTGGTPIKFNSVTGTDTMVKNGVNQTINTRHQSITVMKEYESKIFEELRFEDYCVNRKVGQQGAVGSGLFGSPKTLFGSTATTSTGLFGTNDNKQLFGTASTTPALGGFGNPTTSNVFGTQNSIFGKPQQTTPAFGTQTSTQSFGMNTTQPSIFGSNTAQTSKPFGVASPQTNLFGSTAPSTFGTQTPGFGQAGFGQPNQTNLFGQNKPAFGLGSTQTTTGFGFGTNTSTSANGLFGSKPANTGFQIATPAFGTNNAFGTTPTAQPTTSSLFGSNAFNKAPTTSLFNQSANQQTGVFNNATKPGGLFGQGTQGTGLFGSSNTNAFGTGGTSFFGNNTQSTGIGLFGNTNSSQLSTNQSSQSNQLQLQLDTLKAMPYGDSPLFKRFYKDVSKVDDLSLVRSQNISLEKFGSYKVSPIPTPKSTPTIRRNFPQFNRKSLFDGLDESPPSIKNQDKADSVLLFNITSPRSSCKKLNLKKESNDSTKLQNRNSIVMHTKPLAKLEQYFSYKQGSPGEGGSQQVDLSINEENDTIAQLQRNKQNSLNSSKGTEANDTYKNDNNNTVILDNQETSIDSNVLVEEDHPTGIKLKRVGYYTIPPLNELVEILDDNGLCIVDGFTIGRYDYGNVYFPDRFNVSGLDLDSIVHIRHREIIIYQDDETKPPLGEGLNRKATVTLDRVWPNDKTSKEPITNPDRIAATNFVAKLQRACVKLGTQFIDYRSDTGSWVFNVEHFSKYALIDSDDDEEEKVVNLVELDVDPKTLTKTVTQKPKVITKQTEIASPKQNVIKPLLDLSMGLDRAQSPHQYLLKSNIQLPAMNPSAGDSHIMHYYDGKENSINVTAQISQNMNLQTHKIQCMKASFDDIFYDEIEPMELDDDTYGQKDKFEDKLEKILETIPEYIISVSPKNREILSKSKALITPINNQGSPKFFISKQKKKVQAVEVLKPILTAPLQAQRFSLKYNPNIRLPFEVKFKNSCNFSKLALINTSSFKVPWSNNLTFLTLNTKSKERFLTSKRLDISHLSTELSGRGHDECSPTIVQKIQIVTPNQTETFIELMTEHLQICMLNSNCDTESKNIPYFYPKSGVEALHSHCSLVAHFSELSEEERYAHVWELIKALWGDSETANVTNSPQEHSYNMARRQGVSDWLEALLEKTMDFNTNENTSRKIFNLVSVHKIMEACDLAISSNECNLAMLLAQLGSENSIRCCIQRQLWQWCSSKADLFIDIDHLKLYTMISGKPLFDSNQGIINVCENLDWVRAFALHLWYIQPPSGTIKDALDCYENAYEGEDFYACKPYKTYNNDSAVDIDDQFATYDVCYHLLKLYTNSSYEIYKIVNPLTHTPDPLDFNFSWLLYNTLQSLGYTQMPDIYASQLHTNFAAQLVSHGLWQWAVFVLLHINDEELRERLIEDTVGRNVELPVCNNYEIVLSEKEIFVLNKLKINEGIIYNAKAILAMTKYKYLEATICYLKAKNWQDAHNVLVSHLLADYILQKDGKITLTYLLDWLTEGSKVEGSLPNTMLDSLTLLEYLKLNNTINKMSAEKSISYIASLCERIVCFSENTSEERMIKTEVSSSIALQIGKLISKLDAENYKILKSLLSTLNSKLTLAEDYTLDELVLAISHYI